MASANKFCFIQAKCLVSACRQSRADNSLIFLCSWCYKALKFARVRFTVMLFVSVVCFRKVHFYMSEVLPCQSYNYFHTCRSIDNLRVFGFCCITFADHSVLWQQHRCGGKSATVTPAAVFCTVSSMLMTWAVGGQIDRITSSDEARRVNQYQWHPMRCS